MLFRQTAGFMNRISGLEARAKMRAKLGQTLYLPLIFLIYGVLLGGYGCTCAFICRRMDTCTYTRTFTYRGVDICTCTLYVRAGNSCSFHLYMYVYMYLTKPLVHCYV